jgi:hypothetical protein
MKQFALPGLSALFLLSLSLFLPACDNSLPATYPPSYPPALTNTVYAGEDAAGAWATFAFIVNDDDEEILYYFPDNVGCYEGAYSYAEGSGQITEIAFQMSRAEHDPLTSVPGAFTISEDGKTMAFAAYLTQGPRSFKRVRDGDAVDDEVPFSYAPLAAGDSLDGTVWAATAFRTKDWTTLTVTATDPAAGTIQVSHSFDCTSYPRAYTDYAYDQPSTLAYIGPFRLKGDNFTFLNFYGHGGEITLKRMR